ncbi:hypothetical protein R6U77_05475 [Lysinibacillus louembei]|uniref:Secreted protein n=1 Tax=Lysinibacillus louembei TaxID=1470088 RepID=A0ABZ0S0H2_9BACI|nr:hypothetical protein [Lysinibacillus louembei]WPK13139.1 hypothetical protein R6U77_05475 [Lysinibacillus louembei]
MKKAIIGSALAVGLLFSGAGQSSANVTQPIDLRNMDLETALMAVQQQRVQLLDNQLKAQLEAAQQGNAQQIDMLRLQSMANKRNEAFDVMTNFIKKMQDSRSSIIGNIR